MSATVTIMGLGYVGLPTAIIAAEKGCAVFGFDANVEKSARIAIGDAPFFETEISSRLVRALAQHKLHIVTKPMAADFFIIAVPTPCFIDAQGVKRADLSHVQAACESIIPVLKPGSCVVIESTIPVGTTEYCAQLLEKKTGMKAGAEFFVSHAPERVLPGAIFREIVYNHRIVGGINEASTQRTLEFYKPFVEGDLYATDARTAELTKLVENSARDVHIAFANEVDALARAARVDVNEVIDLANKHPRIKILNPRCGVGGHCVAVDPWFLVEQFPKETSLIKTSRTINDTKPHAVLHLVEEKLLALHSQLGRPPTITIFGATYKPNVDDLRESPALFIAQELTNHYHHQIFVCEPNAEKSALEKMGITQLVTISEGCKSDLLVLLVEHSVFIEERARFTEHPQILDFCGLLYESRKPENSYLTANSVRPTVRRDTSFTI